MKNRTIIIITSVLCVLPVILSLALYGQLPDQIAVHWGSTGEANRYMPRAVAAFGLPVFFLLVNLYSKIRLLNDPKHEGHSKALRAISIWAIPIASLILVPITLFIALGAEIPITTIITLVVGILFSCIGNYMPKNRQNYVMGIKLPWTFNNAENWNKTNRLAGYVMMAGGAAILVSGFIPSLGTIFGISVIILIAAFIVCIPFIYSYTLYRKEQRNSMG